MMDKMRKVAKQEVGKHVETMHKDKKPKKFYAGGKTNEGMLKHGRGMEKVMNQKTGMKKP